MPLTGPRSTPRRADSTMNNSIAVPAAASVTFYPGALVATTSGGYLTNGATATTLTAVGVFGEQPFYIPATSYTSSGTTGADTYEVQLGQFKFNNSESDAVVQGDLLKVCYIEDNQTVCHTGTGKSVAGTVMGIDDATSPTGAGVWVLVGGTPAGLVGSAGPTGATGATGPTGPTGPTGA